MSDDEPSSRNEKPLDEETNISIEEKIPLDENTKMDIPIPEDSKCIVSDKCFVHGKSMAGKGNFSVLVEAVAAMDESSINHMSEFSK